MIILLLVVHVLVALALVGVVLLQKSEGGALGMGGGGMSGFMTGRSTANLLTRTTAILAPLFMLTSMSLVWFSNRERAPRSIIEQGAPDGAGCSRRSGRPAAANPARGAAATQPAARTVSGRFAIGPHLRH